MARNVGDWMRRVAVGVAWLSSGALAGPTPIAVNNAGFEADPVASGCFAVFQPQGWQAYDPGGILDASSDVVGGLYPVGGPYYLTPPPEGDQVGIVFLAGDTGTSPAGLSQVLAAALEANRRYTLSAFIGNIASGTGPPPCDVFGFFNLDGFPGYQVQLLAGGVVIAMDDNSLDGLIADGSFGFTSISVDIGSAHAQLGQALEIRLINLNVAGTAAQPGIEVNFDDIVLTFEPLETCAADQNNDSILDFFDVQSFLASFSSQLPAGDFNDDGIFDFFDVQSFLAAFAAGC
jgi:hypothetical protein